jgi:hypothetical protein
MVCSMYIHKPFTINQYESNGMQFFQGLSKLKGVKRPKPIFIFGLKLTQLNDAYRKDFDWLSVQDL